jgi:hypothetical protein
MQVQVQERKSAFIQAWNQSEERLRAQVSKRAQFLNWTGKAAEKRQALDLPRVADTTHFDARWQHDKQCHTVVCKLACIIMTSHHKELLGD